METLYLLTFISLETALILTGIDYAHKFIVTMPTFLPKPDKQKMTTISEGNENYDIFRSMNETSKLRPFSYELLHCNRKTAELAGYENESYGYLYFLKNYAVNFNGRKAFLEFMNYVEDDMKKRGIRKVETHAYLGLVRKAKKHGFKSKYPMLEKIAQALPLPQIGLPTITMTKSLDCIVTSN